MIAPNRPIFVPAAHEVRVLSRILPIHAEFLEYAIMQALEQCQPGSIAYDGVNDTVIYHYRLIPELDYTMFQAFEGIEEIWVIQKAGGEVAS